MHVLIALTNNSSSNIFFLNSIHLVICKRVLKCIEHPAMLPGMQGLHPLHRRFVCFKQNMHTYSYRAQMFIIGIKVRLHLYFVLGIYMYKVKPTRSELCWKIRVFTCNFYISNLEISTPARETQVIYYFNHKPLSLFTLFKAVLNTVLKQKSCHWAHAGPSVERLGGKLPDDITLSSRW